MTDEIFIVLFEIDFILIFNLKNFYLEFDYKSNIIIISVEKKKQFY